MYSYLELLKNLSQFAIILSDTTKVSCATDAAGTPSWSTNNFAMCETCEKLVTREENVVIDCKVKRDTVYRKRSKVAR